jgi:hypothetical protein
MPVKAKIDLANLDFSVAYLLGAGNCNFARSVAVLFALYMAVSHGDAWEPLAVNFAENER